MNKIIGKRIVVINDNTICFHSCTNLLINRLTLPSQESPLVMQRPLLLVLSQTSRSH